MYYDNKVKMNSFANEQDASSTKHENHFDQALTRPDVDLSHQVVLD